MCVDNDPKHTATIKRSLSGASVNGFIFGQVKFPDFKPTKPTFYLLKRRLNRETTKQTTTELKLLYKPGKASQKKTATVWRCRRFASWMQPLQARDIQLNNKCYLLQDFLLLFFWSL